MCIHIYSVHPRDNCQTRSSYLCYLGMCFVLKQAGSLVHWNGFMYGGPVQWWRWPARYVCARTPPLLDLADWILVLYARLSGRVRGGRECAHSIPTIVYASAVSLALTQLCCISLFVVDATLFTDSPAFPLSEVFF